jgi:transcription termination factor NusB
LPLFELAFNVTPDDVVINEAVVCKISHNILTFLVTWQFLI